MNTLEQLNVICMALCKPYSKIDDHGVNLVDGSGGISIGVVVPDFVRGCEEAGGYVYPRGVPLTFWALTAWAPLA